MSWFELDHTHDAGARCWVKGADGHESFPVQNLPLGLFSDGDSGPRAGVAIGDFVLDVAGLVDTGLLPDLDYLAYMVHERLNELLALGAPARRALRHSLFALLTDSRHQAAVSPFLAPISQLDLHLPCEVGDYTDFYAGIHHAAMVGKLFRPDNPLLPNYRHVPIGYHGRASSVVLSGTPVKRPSGQLPGPDGPRLGPTERLDLELELGVWIGPGNPLGCPVPIWQAAEHVAGFCLLNDWSARDIQAWEYQPLGPFLAKNFATTISPWIVTLEALAPYRTAWTRPAEDPQPLGYLDGDGVRKHGAIDLQLEAWIESAKMRADGSGACRLSHTSLRHSYWTVGQMVAHHSVGGCNLQPGDLLGSGTQSGPAPGQGGSLLELTNGGRRPLALPGGETRTFLLDGDTVILRAHCAAPGRARIGFGAAAGTVVG
jgi:fumarylacetoacetase